MMIKEANITTLWEMISKVSSKVLNMKMWRKTLERWHWYLLLLKLNLNYREKQQNRSKCDTRIDNGLNIEMKSRGW